MSNSWQSTKGFTAAAVAFVSCPCHLPLTLPLLLTITAGTALGGWIANNTTTIYIAATLLFIYGLVLVGRWLFTNESEVCQVNLKENQLKKS